jgi:hypothetical protein
MHHWQGKASLLAESPGIPLAAMLQEDASVPGPPTSIVLPAPSLSEE